MYLENCIYENNPKNVKRLEIGKDIRGVILTDMLNIKQVTNQKYIKPILIQCKHKNTLNKNAREPPILNAIKIGRSNKKERRVDALALRADEGRDKLRKAVRRSKYPLYSQISE